MTHKNRTYPQLKRVYEIDIENYSSTLKIRNRTTTLPNVIN